MLHTPLSAIPDYLVPYRSRIRSKQFDADQAGVHFFLDDYRFETVWTRPKRALEHLKKYRVLLTPDFSLYADWPLAMQMWNVYRSRWLGRWWQALGFEVIPTVSWSTTESYEFCFLGIPKHSTVAISSVGTVQKTNFYSVQFINGFESMVRELDPTCILVYGHLPEEVNSRVQIANFSTHWDKNK